MPARSGFHTALGPLVDQLDIANVSEIWVKNSTVLRMHPMIRNPRHFIPMRDPKDQPFFRRKGQWHLILHDSSDWCTLSSHAAVSITKLYENLDSGEA